MSNATCAFKGCGRSIMARGFCVAHYTQARRGTPLHPVGEVKNNMYVSLTVPAEVGQKMLADKAGALKALTRWAKKVITP